MAIDAIAAALAAAETAAEQTPSAPVPAAAPAACAVYPAAQRAPRTLQDLMATAAMNVDCYLSVSDLGIRFGKDKQLHDTVDIEMVFKNAKTGLVLRVNTPAGVRYLTSYDDGGTEHRSRQPWAAVVADAQKMDGNAYVSDLVELPAKLLNDYARKEGGPVTTGTVVGLSLSYMNFKAFAAFLQEQFPKFGMDTPFKVRLSAVAKKGSGQDYGVFGWEVIDDAAGDAPAAKGGKKAA